MSIILSLSEPSVSGETTEFREKSLRGAETTAAPRTTGADWSKEGPARERRTWATEGIVGRY
jgi:hypothetical protein